MLLLRHIAACIDHGPGLPATGDLSKSFSSSSFRCRRDWLHLAMIRAGTLFSLREEGVFQIIDLAGLSE